jgi:hypothetical protein
MSGRARLSTLAAAAVSVGLGLAAPAEAAPDIARPNPALSAVHPDYVAPIPGVGGTPATLAPLNPAVIAVAVADQKYLAERTNHDLGGFSSAPAGQPVFSGGHNLVGALVGTSQIPQLAQAANGTIQSFAATGQPSTPPDQGQQPVPGLGVPPPVTPPSNNNAVPPPNQGFGGTPSPNPAPTTTEPTTTAPPPTTRTTPTTPTPTTPTTTTPTVTTPTTTTAPAQPPQAPPPTPSQPPVAPPSTGASCGTSGLTITSDHSTCRIVATNMAPGGSASEVMTIRNDTDAPFTLALRAAGSQNLLWQHLRLGVWESGTAAPVPLPPLLFWTGQANELGTLAPGESVRYEIELFLPPTAGNADQALAASIDLVWSAQG